MVVGLSRKADSMIRFLGIYLKTTSPVRVVIIPLTTQSIDKVKSVEVYVKNDKETGLDYPSKLPMQYPRTIDKNFRLITN